MDGTMQYCQDLRVDPAEVVMLALAWFTKAPTMGRFAKRDWVEAWQAVGCVHSFGVGGDVPPSRSLQRGKRLNRRSCRADSLEKQRQQVDALREQLQTAEVFRKVYIFAFDYAKQEGQKSLRASPLSHRPTPLYLRRSGLTPGTLVGGTPETEFEIAQELWNLLIPLDPASSFPPEHLALWIEFLSEKGGRAVSKDSWNLVSHAERGAGVRLTRDLDSD